MRMQHQPIVLVLPPGERGTLLLGAFRESGFAVADPPGLLAPLLHLGYWRKVHHAAYDHILAAEAQRLFVSKLPEGEDDYVTACRAYACRLYGASDTRVADTDGSYAALLPLIARVLPDACYIVVTRNPVYGLYDTVRGGEQHFTPLIKRQAVRWRRDIRAVAWFLRARPVPALEVRYPDLLAEPAETFDAISQHIGQRLERSQTLREAIARAKNRRRAATQALAAKADVRREINEAVSAFCEADCTGYGYAYQEMWEDVSALIGRPMAPDAGSRRRGAMRRWIARGLQRAASRPGLKRVAQRALLTADVLLRKA